ncbi:MAG: protein tyrosine phosphatase [Bacillales bacterium]|nr:protein tyrosine phosphatase [Bacillales bacterium]
MINVLFVCLGNICRSPMAEAVFRHLIIEQDLAGKIKVDSAGTGDWHIGHPPHEGTQKILSDKKISFEGMKARQVLPSDFVDYQYIIAMDNSNISNLEKWEKQGEPQFIGRLLDFVPDSNIQEVPDPYFTGNFNETYELILKGCKNLLEKIIKDHDLL